MTELLGFQNFGFIGKENEQARHLYSDLSILFVFSPNISIPLNLALSIIFNFAHFCQKLTQIHVCLLRHTGHEKKSGPLGGFISKSSHYT